MCLGRFRWLTFTHKLYYLALIITAGGHLAPITTENDILDYKPYTHRLGYAAAYLGVNPLGPGGVSFLSVCLWRKLPADAVSVPSLLPSTTESDKNNYKSLQRFNSVLLVITVGSHRLSLYLPREWRSCTLSVFIILSSGAAGSKMHG